MADNPWMDRLGFSISEEDHELLSTQLRVLNPRSLPDLRRDIPDGATIQTVELAYHVTASDKQRSLWIRCCECRTDRNHKCGVVVRLEDGTRATVGRVCGLEKHGLDFALLIKEFDGRVRRARLLRQTIATLEHVSVVQNFLQALRAHPAVLASRNTMREMDSKLPELCRRVRDAPEGRITGKMNVRDGEAERRRDDRLERKLADAAQRKAVSRDATGVDRALFEELAASGDRDASKDPIYKKESRTVHRVVGHGFFSLLPNTGLRVVRLNERLVVCFKDLEGKTSKEVTKRRMEIIYAEFDDIMKEAEKLHGMVRAALAFGEPANVAALVRANNRFFKAGDARLLHYEDGVLRKVSSPDGMSVRLAPPVFDLSTAALGRVRRAVQDAFTGGGETEDAEVSIPDEGPLPWLAPGDGSGMDAHLGPA